MTEPQRQVNRSPAELRRHDERGTVEILFFALILLVIPFVLPIAAWVSARKTARRLETLLRVVESQEKEIDELRSRVTQLSREATPSPSPASRPCSGRSAEPHAARRAAGSVPPPASCRRRRRRPRPTGRFRRRRHRPFRAARRGPSAPRGAPASVADAAGPSRLHRRPVRRRPRRRRGHRRLRWCLGLPLRRRRLRLHPAGRPRRRSTGRVSSA